MQVDLGWRNCFRVFIGSLLRKGGQKITHNNLPNKCPFYWDTVCMPLLPYIITWLTWRVICLFYNSDFTALFLVLHFSLSMFGPAFSVKLECGPMPNVMAALPNISGAVCWTPQSWLTPTIRMSCTNAANIGERKTWTQSEFCTW